MGEAFPDPSDEQRRLAIAADYQAQRERYAASLQPGTAEAASDLARGYPGVTPDLVAGFGAAGGRFPDMDIAQVVRRD